MKYKFDIDSWGAQFCVPAVVANDYLKLSDGNYIKVLLCVLAGQRVTTTDAIAEKTGIAPGEIDDAIIYWRNLGVISFDGSENTSASEAKTAGFSSKNQPVSQVEAVRASAVAEDKKIVVNYSQREIKEKAENDSNLKQLVNDIQGILQFSINGKELGRLVELYELYRFDVPTILLTADYCKNIGKSSIAYLYSVMVRWFESGIMSYSDVEKKIISQNALHDFENNVLRIFGIVNKPSKKQKDFIEKWKNIGFSYELLEIAYNKCMDSNSKLNFGYIDKILENWSNNGVVTSEDVRKNDENFKSRYAKKTEGESERDTSYDLEEFENFALKFSLSGGRKEG